MAAILECNFRDFISSQTQLALFGEGLALESGAQLPELRIAYRSWGELNAAKDNAVVICHALTGSADAALRPSR